MSVPDRFLDRCVPRYDIKPAQRDNYFVRTYPGELRGRCSCVCPPAATGVSMPSVCGRTCRSLVAHVVDRQQTTSADNTSRMKYCTGLRSLAVTKQVAHTLCVHASSRQLFDAQNALAHTACITPSTVRRRHSISTHPWEQAPVASGSPVTSPPSLQQPKVSSERGLHTP